MGALKPPPVSAWPPEVFPDEPVHGFFQRLASVNGQMSCRTFAACLGLNGRNFDFEELLDFCTALPIRGVDELRRSTPRRANDTVMLRGEAFSPTHFAFASVRVCAACVSESRYHRVWFDFSFVERCPLHGQLMIGGVESEKLARWFSGVGTLPHTGIDLAKAAPKAPLEDTLAWYILGRVGCLPKRSIPFLDKYTCSEVIQVSDLLGRMAEFGWSRSLKPKLSWDADRQRRTEHGFSLLSQGRESVLKSLKAFTSSSTVRSSPGTISFAIGEFYGWLYSAVRNLGHSSIIDDFREMMMLHAERSGVISRKSRFLVSDEFDVETLRLRTH